MTVMGGEEEEEADGKAETQTGMVAVCGKAGIVHRHGLLAFEGCLWRKNLKAVI